MKGRNERGRGRRGNRASEGAKPSPWETIRPAGSSRSERAHERGDIKGRAQALPPGTDPAVVVVAADDEEWQVLPASPPFGSDGNSSEVLGLRARKSSIDLKRDRISCKRGEICKRLLSLR